MHARAGATRLPAVIFDPAALDILDTVSTLSGGGLELKTTRRNNAVGFVSNGLAGRWS
jgi:hypothetical protein